AGAVRAVAALGEGFLRTAPYDDAEAALRAIRGIGPFSAQAILLRGLGRMERMDPRGAAFARAARLVYRPSWAPEATLARYGASIGYWAYYLRVGADG